VGAGHVNGRSIRLLGREIIQKNVVSLTGIEPVSVDYRERSLTVEEIRLAGWSPKIVPQIVP
jgi:hypothetical protein